MYKALNVDIFRKNLGLPADYTLDGLLVTGVFDLWGEELHLPHVVNYLNDNGYKYEISKFIQKDIGHAHELKLDNKVIWFVPVMGTAIMSLYAHVASLLGSRKNILIGTVGGLCSDVNPGDLIFPTKVIGNDSALMYQPEKTDKIFFPDNALTERLVAKVPKTSKVFKGTTITCETLLAETWDDVLNWSKQGFLGVEMEAAMIFALSAFFKVPSAAILTVGDNLIREETMFHENHEKQKEVRLAARKLQYQLALAELLAE